jgi:hypothetical protein
MSSNNLESYTVDFLKQLAKEKKLRGYSNLNKKELIIFLEFENRIQEKYNNLTVNQLRSLAQLYGYENINKLKKTELIELIRYNIGEKNIKRNLDQFFDYINRLIKLKEKDNYQQKYILEEKYNLDKSALILKELEEQNFEYSLKLIN